MKLDLQLHQCPPCLALLPAASAPLIPDLHMASPEPGSPHSAELEE
jgi:hypothetical protein